MPGKEFRNTLWWCFSGEAKKNKTRPRPGRKTGTFAMTFTGTLIEGLMATVERAEQRAQTDEPIFAEQMVVEPWFASVQENADYDSKFLGVA
ncbi:MAG: hypothetical protein LAO30_00910 [Acidobacteriia bacterium]|nr:hypothetical protein [Terriglobia bacterium]